MDFDTARHVLLLHGIGTVDNNGDPLVKKDGFLGILRPYRGLHEQNFHDVMEALFAVADHIEESTAIDRELIYSLWEMCYLARLWGVNPRGMLRRNKLIDEADVARLEKWIDVIEYSSLRILSGHYRGAIHTYANYIVEHGAGSNAENLVPLLASALETSDLDIEDPSTIAEALGKLGSLARPALPQLRDAATKTYRMCEPIERFTAEVRETINTAIGRIEDSNPD